MAAVDKHRLRREPIPHRAAGGPPFKRRFHERPLLTPCSARIGRCAARQSRRKLGHGRQNSETQAGLRRRDHANRGNHRGSRPEGGADDDAYQPRPTPRPRHAAWRRGIVPRTKSRCVAAFRGLRDGFPRAPALAVFVAPDRAAFCKVWPPLRASLRGGAPALVFYKIPVEPFLDA